MAYETDSNITVVEFDGDSHYKDSLVIKRDRVKDAIADSLGYQVIRIPYWVQLTNETAYYYFQFDVQIEQDFPHGFGFRQVGRPY